MSSSEDMKMRVVWTLPPSRWAWIIVAKFDSFVLPGHGTDAGIREISI